jgi:hypothetical protein
MSNFERRLERLAVDFSRREYTLLLGVVRQNARRHPEHARYWRSQRRRLQEIQQQQQQQQHHWEAEEYRRLSLWIDNLAERYNRGEEEHVEISAELESVIAIITSRLTVRGEHILERAVNLRARINDPHHLHWEEVESALDCRLFGGLIANTQYAMPEEFLDATLPVLVERFRSAMTRLGQIKVNAVLQSRFVQGSKSTEHLVPISSGTFTLRPGDDVEASLRRHLIEPIMRHLDTFEEGDSGLALDEILYLKVNVNKFVMIPCRGSTYVKMPDWVIRTGAVVNVKNKDDKCLLWSILAHLHPQTTNASRVTKYMPYIDELKFHPRDFPMTWRGIKNFEADNDLRLYVFAWDETEKRARNGRLVYPWFVSRRSTGTIVDLFITMAEDGESFHFALIKDIHKFMHGMVGPTRGRGEFCRNCMQYVEHRQVPHHRDCGRNRPAKVELPQESSLRFRHHRYREPVPVVCYGDFECCLEREIYSDEDDADDEEETRKRRVYHHPVAAGLYVLAQPFVTSVESVYRSHVGLDCVRWFVEEVMAVADALGLEYRKNIPVVAVDLERYRDAKCCVCEKPFGRAQVRAIEHDHWTGALRGVAHQSCNLQYREPRVVPVFLHNLTGYDGHFIVDELTRDQEKYGEVSILPTTTERYISFSVQRNPELRLRVTFVDSYRFLARSLECLGRNLRPEDKRILRDEFPAELDFELVSGKLSFPYEWFQHIDQLQQTHLPTQSQFDNLYNDRKMSDDEYRRVQRVWCHFQLSSMRDMLLLYLKVDVCLLADVFEAFRVTCRRTYNLDPAHYLTAASLALDAALKFTNVRLDLLMSVDQVQFIERAIRGGVAQCSMRYAESSEDSCIVDIDANNLYGWAMSQPLPIGLFSWVPPCLWRQLIGRESEQYGYFLEVDCEYPEDLWELHSDFPLAPEHRVPPPLRRGEKLLCTFYPKERYVVYYRTLELYLQLGLKVTKVHRVLRFAQSEWLRPYIQLNTSLRQQATNEFERDFYKFMNNSVFGKFIENVRRRRKVKIVSRWEGKNGASALIASPQFRSQQVMTEDRVIIELRQSKVVLEKPVYVGAVILDLAKYLMYDFHYGMVKRHLPDARLAYTDTDSFIYYLPSCRSFADLYALDPSCFDTSNYPPSHPLYSTHNKDVIGKFKDETKGKPVRRFRGLRAKMFCLEVEGEEELRKRAKGLREPVVRGFTFDDYNNPPNTRTKVKQAIFRSVGHRVYTETVEKKGLCALDDKRFVLPDDPHNTLPWSEETEAQYYRYQQEVYSGEDDDLDYYSSA